MTRSRRAGGISGNAACKNPRRDEKEAVRADANRGDVRGDVASVDVEKAEELS
jgi:hypothetical protein